MPTRKPRIEEAAAVVMNGNSTIVGIVTQIDRTRGLAWIAWPDECGLSEACPISSLQIVCERDLLISVIQAIAPQQQLQNPLERAFLNAARADNTSAQIIEYGSQDPKYRSYR